MANYNANHHSVKRILREIKEFQNNEDPDITAAPLGDDIFEWHFTMRGPPDSDFEGGIYHGRVILPIEYPLKPPDIILLTPSGRFKPGKKICLSNSSYHPENWQPAWSIRTALVALRGFMPTAANGAVGSMNLSPAKRQELAKKSIDWKCDTCKSSNRTALPEIEFKNEPMEEEPPELSPRNNLGETHERENEGDLIIEQAQDETVKQTEAIGAQPEPDVAIEDAELRQRVHIPVQERVINAINVENNAGAPRVIRVSPIKLNIFLGFLVSLLVFLIVRRFIS